MVGSTGKHVQPSAVSTKTVVCFGYHERPHGATSRRRHDINDSMMVIIWATTTVGELLQYSLFRCLVNSKLQWTIFTYIYLNFEVAHEFADTGQQVWHSVTIEDPLGIPRCRSPLLCQVAGKANPSLCQLDPPILLVKATWLTSKNII